ncbi:Metallo-hydrolase/oxidoreductase [Aspergillus niger ATCC 13496]|uniref:Metallo-hydrolase/oxidoreductase n=1 Tax=Aspergillus niger ATCC 13496 TaxID=1353008 RepID=A0A370CB80_ASPNG|nr:Metallo-hydrolase/oxidoreductase [Aspergillus niger ATCC 13496]
MSPHSSLPVGSKLWLLDSGTLDIDASYVLSGANVPKSNQPSQIHDTRQCLMIAALLYHPDLGLILFDTGACEDIINSWDKEFLECVPRTWVKDIHSLPAAVKATGAGDITDIKAVVMSHLHLDHAGGLEHFFFWGQIWCHEKELKNAFWASATGHDSGLFRPDYLRADLLNWKTVSEQVVELWSGVTLHMCPGHTEGFLVVELKFQVAGTVVLTGDLFHVKENYEDGQPQGFLMRDYNTWHRSRDYVRRLVRQTNAKVCLGHEKSYFDKFVKSPEYLV